MKINSAITDFHFYSFKLIVIGFITMFIISNKILAQDGVQIDYTTPTVRDPRAILQLNSTNQGFLVPRVASTGDVGIPSTTGLLVYQTNSPAGFYYYNGTAWVMIANTSSGSVTADNGLNVNTANNVRLGGTISVNPTNIALAGNAITFSGVSSSEVAIGTTTPSGVARLYVQSSSSAFDAINAMHQSSSTTGAFAGIKGEVAHANYTNASGQLGYHSVSGNATYGVYGTAGDYGGVFARPVSISSVAPTSTSNDLEVRNITGGNPVQIFLRQGVSNTTSGTVLSNLDFGDNNTSTGQARIQVVRDGASSGSSDLPTAITFSTIADNTSTLLERIRIANSGEVRLLTSSLNPRGYLQAIETGTNNGAGAGSGLIIATSGGENIAFKDNGLAGDENLTIMGASGNVGIGANNPQQKLHVTGNTRVTGLASGASGAIVRSNTTGDLSITNFTGIATDILTGAGTFVGISTISGDDWTQSGSNLYPNNLSWNVGIGTTSPSGMLHVGTAANRSLLVGSNGLTSIRFDDNSSPAVLTLENRAMTAINHGVNINFGLNIGGAAPITSGQIKTGAEDTYIGVGNQDSYMSFSTAANASLSEKVRIKSDGNVGIATTSPAYTLQVGHETAGNNTNYSLSVSRHGDLATPGTYSADIPALRVWDVAADGPASAESRGLVDIAAPRIADADANAANAMLLAVSNDNGFGLTVKGNRNVGIGTSAPAQRLEVSGNTRITGLASGASGAIVRSNTSGDLSVTNFTGTGTDVLTGAGTFAAISTISGDDWTQTGSLLYPNNTTWNVGIGNTSPSFKLDVTGTARIGTTGGVAIYSTDANTVNFRPSISNGDILITDDSGTSARGMTIANGGSVGIGTDAPLGKLHVYNTSAYNGDENDDAVSSIVLHSSVNNANGSHFGGITWASSGRKRAGISSVMENADADYVGLAFWTQGIDGPGSMFESMRIARSGNVGIGTTIPGAKLHVGGSNQALRIDYNGTDNYFGSLRWAGLQLGNNGDNRIVAGRTATGGNLRFYVNNTNDAADYSVVPNGTLAMSMLSNGNINIPGLNASSAVYTDASKNLTSTAPTSGSLGYWTRSGTNLYNTTLTDNVGIGNPSPSFKLDVTGTARIGTTGGVAIYSTDANTVNFRPSIGNGDILITDDSGTPARGMTIANGGSVGIGTDAPPNKLRVESTVADAIHLKANTSGTAPYHAAMITAEANADYRGRGLFLPTTDAAAGASWFAGVPYTGAGFQIGNSSIHTYQDGNGPYILANAKLFIKPDGNVGIGNTSPATKLQLNYTSSGGLTGLSAYGGIHLDQDAGADGFTGITTSATSSGTQGGILFQGSGSYGTKIHFLTTSSYAAGMQNRMTIDHLGNVGIGTTAPTEKLSVAGAITSANFQVKRDFLTWNTTANTNVLIHIKTNIACNSIMYRFLVEGYNYGMARAINSEAVGYHYGGDCSTLYNVQNINHSNGVSISQYRSSDGYVVLKLDPGGSNYYLGFSVSGWFTNPAGNAFNVTATVYHQNANL